MKRPTGAPRRKSSSRLKNKIKGARSKQSRTRRKNLRIKQRRNVNFEMVAPKGIGRPAYILLPEKKRSLRRKKRRDRPSLAKARLGSVRGGIRQISKWGANNLKKTPSKVKRRRLGVWFYGESFGQLF